MPLTLHDVIYPITERLDYLHSGQDEKFDHFFKLKEVGTSSNQERFPICNQPENIASSTHPQNAKSSVSDKTWFIETSEPVLRIASSQLPNNTNFYKI